jgi:hypothetical protein
MEEDETEEALVALESTLSYIRHKKSRRREKERTMHTRKNNQ